MMKIIALGTLILLISGCSGIFTNAKEIEPNVYQITAHGNIFNSQEAMLAKAYKKAEKRCGHSNFSKTGEAIAGNTKIYNAQINGYTDSPNVTIKVNCSDEQ